MTTLETPAPSLEAIRLRYQNVVETLITKLKQDPYVLAVVLYGSVAYDVVWEKSDIDLCIITQETRIKTSEMVMVEDSINIHASVITRSEFKKELEGSVQGSFLHSMYMRGQLLFTRDEALEELWANRRHFGERDREISLLLAAITPIACLPKAKKWLFARNNPHYSFVWILSGLNGLAKIETILAGELPGREVLAQALRHNAPFFQSLYIDLVDSPKTPERISTALTQYENYLRDRATTVFRPLFNYLAEAEGPRSAREINSDFKKQMGIEGAFFLCEWLADEGFIQKIALPARLTEKSKVDVEEAAFYYDGSPL